MQVQHTPDAFANSQVEEKFIQCEKNQGSHTSTSPGQTSSRAREHQARISPCLQVP